MLLLLAACWRPAVDSDATPFEVSPLLTAPLPLPARFQGTLPDDDSPYAAGQVAVDELSRGLCQGNAAMRGKWLEAISRRLAAGSDPTVIGLQWGTLALGCEDHDFCAWARDLAESESLSASERSIVSSLSVSCSEPEDLQLISRQLREAVISDDYPRVHGLVAVIQWRRDPSWIREEINADLPLARSERVRDALAMALSQSGDEHTRGLILDACIRRSGSEDPDEQRLYAPCSWYASLLDTGTLMPVDEDPGWVRHPEADPAAYATRHPDAVPRLVAQLDTCVIDGLADADPSSTVACLRSLMALDRPKAVQRSSSVTSQVVDLTRLVDELRRFPTLAERNAAFARAGLPPSTAGTIADALADTRRLASIIDEESCRGRLDRMLAILPSLQGMSWEAVGPTTTGWTLDAWDPTGRSRARVGDDDDLCDSRGLAAGINAVLARRGDPLRLGFVNGDPYTVVAIDPAMGAVDWLDLQIPARLPPTP